VRFFLFSHKGLGWRPGPKNLALRRAKILFVDMEKLLDDENLGSLVTFWHSGWRSERKKP
jgi:hypothetical protein